MQEVATSNGDLRHWRECPSTIGGWVRSPLGTEYNLHDLYDDMRFRIKNIQFFNHDDDMRNHYDKDSQHVF